MTILNRLSPKTFLIVFSFFAISFTSFSQLGAAFHQSNLPFLGLNYQFGERFIPEFRAGTDMNIDYLSYELTANYILKNDSAYQIYSGLGGRMGDFEGVVIPLGLNIYPFENKNFGFHIEAAAIVGELEILRGSWGIRYRFD